MPTSSATRWLLICILALALFLRLLGLQTQSFSMDEISELGIGHSPLLEIFKARDGFPPLYHSILHEWFAIFPADPTARWLSALLGTAGVWAVSGLAREAGGPWVGVWTALLVAVSPFQIWHAQEARAYVLYYLLAAGAFWAFFIALRTNTRGAWLAYVALAWMGLLTHYHFALLILANLSILVVERGGRPPRRPIMAHVLLGLLALPIMWLLRGDFSAEAAAPFANHFRVAAIGYTLFSFLAGYGLGPSPRQLHELDTMSAVTASLPWLLLTAAAGGVLLLHGLRVLGIRLWGQRLLLAGVVPVILVVTVAGLAGVTYQVRHVLWASIPLMVVLGAGCSEWRSRPSVRFATVTLLALFALSRYHRQNMPEYENEDVRGLADYLRTTSTSAPVFVLSGYMAEPARYYLGQGWKVEGLPELGERGDSLSAALRLVDSTVAPNRPFWVAYTRAFHGDPRGRFLDTLSRLRPLRRRIQFAGIVLYAGGGAPEGR